MTRTIHLLDAGEQLVEMREGAYDSEDDPIHFIRAMQPSANASRR